MFREKEWRNSFHQKIDTGHKAFDRQTTMISHGNQIGNTIFSKFVRAVDNTTCNGHNFEKGHLRAYDLNFNLPEFIREWYRSHPNWETILYQFFHYNKGKKIVHGYVITSTDYKLLFSCNRSHVKSQRVIQECITYITVE